MNNKFFRIGVLFLSVLAGSCLKAQDSAGETSITDVDGNVYYTVAIGTQTWMAENLKTTKYNDGSDIPLVTDDAAWGSIATPAYCWYNNDQNTFMNKYGALYNWYTVNTNKLCPAGWHVPSDNDWTKLSDFLGGEKIAGGKLKEVGTTHWLTPNTGATNETKLTALPGGFRFDMDSSFGLEAGAGYWWTSTAAYSFAKQRELHSSEAELFIASSPKNSGYSVICIKD